MKTLIAAAVLVLAGCAPMMTLDEERQVGSSGLIGCAPKEIAISDSDRYTWAASCKGKVYRCSVAPTAACSATP